MSSENYKLDPVELSFDALHSNTTAQVISILCVVEKAIPEKHFREKFQQLLPKYKRLNYILKSPNWLIAQNYDPQQSLHFINLEPAVDFLSFCQHEYSKSLDSDLPPWKILIISGDTNAIHFIFHHSLADGMGIIDLIKDLADNNKEYLSSSDTNSHYLSYKWQAFKLVLSDYFKKDSLSPINGINTSTRNLNLINLSLKEINLARKHYQVSLHEYMLGLVTIALEQYLKAKNFDLEKLNILTPVSHRNPKSSTKLGNYLTGMAVEFSLKHISVKSRLEEIRASFRDKIKEKKDQIYIYLAQTVAKIPVNIRKNLCNFSARKTNLICSSVPSSGKAELTICGSKILYKYGTVALMRGHGISFAFTRYLDSMCVCLVNDPNIVNDPNKINDLILESHREIYEKLINA